MDNRKYFNIIGGPSRDLLFDACKYACAQDGAFLPIRFKVVWGYTMPPDDPGCAYVGMPVERVRITEIAHEDGSGQSFNLKGYCLTTTEIGCGSKLERHRFLAYYNTQKRTGTIRFEKE